MRGTFVGVSWRYPGTRIHDPFTKQALTPLEQRLKHSVVWVVSRHVDRANAENFGRRILLVLSMAWLGLPAWNFCNAQSQPTAIPPTHI